MSSIKNVAVLTSGGDAPGMNAAIRSIVRSATAENLRVTGVFSGFRGLVDKSFEPLGPRSVANIIQRGGTILKTARCKEFFDKSVREKAVETLKAHQIDALIGIGGDGTFAGLKSLYDELDFPVIGVPGTIDNDIFGTDFTIGFDTAVNTALEAIDRIRDTAASHNRLFIVEVMGHETGFLALNVGLAGGAEEIFVPEQTAPIQKVIDHIQKGARSGKLSSLLITAEGSKPGRAYDLAESLRKKANLESKVCILGHIQRGGTPTALDRILGSRLGAYSVRLLQNGQFGVMAGSQGGNEVAVPLKDCIEKKKKLNLALLELARILSH